MNKSEYPQVLEEFLAEAAVMFRNSGKSEKDLRSSLAKYLGRGLTKSISQGELIDFLGVSSPSVLEEAGYSETEQERAMSLLGALTDAEIRLYVSGRA